MLKRLHYLCHTVAGYLFLVILMAALGAETALTVPGLFLFSRFHLASLYFPGLILLAGVFIKSDRTPGNAIPLLWLSPLPFLTAAVAFQTAAGSLEFLAAGVLVDAFGRFPAAALLFLLFAMEIAGLVKVATFRGSPDDILFTFTALKKRFGAFMAYLGLGETEVDEVPAGDDEPTLEDRPVMAFPSFPEIPEPIIDADPPPFGNPVAPEKPVSPASPESDPAVSDLIRRVLTGDPAEIWDTVPSEPAPGDQASPESFQTDDPWPVDPALAFLAGEGTGESEESPVEMLDAGNPGRGEPLVEAPSEFGFSDDPPGEEGDNSAISEKLDPQGTEPRGILVTRKEMTKPHRRKKYEVPVIGVLADYPDSDFSSIDEGTRRGGDVLEQTLKEFKIDAKVTGIRKGPVITMYELLPSPGVKISSIVNLQDNIALRLAASRVRIVAPIPGKHAIGIEVPNKKRAIVSFSSMVDSEEFLGAEVGIPVILGKDISGGNQVIDLTRTPHLLIAGATGSGKSVCVNSLIGSILYSRTPQDVKMIMVDPKIVELKLYNDIPHLLTPVITEPKRAIQALQWCLYEMERRYSLLDTQGVRDMRSYNKRVKDRKLATEPLAYIVVVVDEFADLMATSGKELEGIVARLAAMSRAVGIHLVLATQRPSVDVITGLIKANFPSRIAFMVAGKTDSRIIIDSMGAEKLLGRGDMLFTSAWDPFPSRVQGAFLAEEEVERMADHVKTMGEPDYIDDEMFFDEEDSEEFPSEAARGDDPMYDKALEIVVSSRKASASYLQRRLKIGYNRAARLVEEMERRGIVGPANGSKPRDLIHIPEQFVSPLGGDEGETSSA